MMQPDLMTRPISILIADDHGVVREGIRSYLQTQPDLHVVAEAADGAEAVRLATQHKPDVAMLDLAMPGQAGVDGVDAIRAIRQASPHTRLMVLSSFSDDAHIFPAIRAGALSYLLKDVAPHEMAEAIRRTARGEAVIHPKVAARLVDEVQTQRASLPNPFALLSDREHEVVKLIALGLSNAEIAEQLVLSEKTIKGYVSTIFEKLHVSDRTQAAVLAWQLGLMRDRP
jgi:NarL family two-component system response regulator LiaR